MVSSSTTHNNKKKEPDLLFEEFLEDNQVNRNKQLYQLTHRNRHKDGYKNKK
jgi:hypothetical protein